MSTFDLHEVIKAWVLQLLSSPWVQRGFVHSRGFADSDVADFIGLGSWQERRSFDCVGAAAALREIIQKADPIGSALPPPLASSLKACARAFGLNELEAGIFFCLSLRQASSMYRDALNTVKVQSRREQLKLLGLALGEPTARIVQALQPDKPLLYTGILKWTSGTRRGEILTLSHESFGHAVLEGDFSLGRALQSVAQVAPEATLRPRDFRHLGAIAGDLREHLRSCLKERRAGCNILLHGAPGTGKSELTRVLARGLRCQLMEVAFEDNDGDPLPATGRLQSLRLAQQLLRKGRTLLVFDECEDVFRASHPSGTGLAGQRKAWMNRLLESNPVPVIWISNSSSCIDGAFLRRFDLVVDVPTPPELQRQKIYRRMCRDSISEPLIRRLSSINQLTPAVLARARSVAENIHPKGQARDAAVCRLVENTLRVQGHPAMHIRPPAESEPLRFDHTFLNTDPPLDSFLEHLATLSACRCLLHGPPGTGKTAFGRWLASELNAPLHLKRASDLLSPFIGETERQMAEAFASAQRERAVLMIDEVDSFLRDRRDAQRSWEVTQVNEFLTCVENFEGIFLCSTNLFRNLDAACLRRFDLKVRVDFLRPDQVEKAFFAHCRHLRIRKPSAAQLREVVSLSNATPGDFANVARQHRFNPISSPADFLTLLSRECATKTDTGVRSVGFHSK